MDIRYLNHKGIDFDALLSIVAANLSYPGIVTIAPESPNPNVRVFLSLHKDLFDLCTPGKISFDDQT
jgi:tRNA nucleotidyltransferase (CCA-adding enzyme)